jgi:carbonic anhydrase/acetyltransferase-like protein (isoleucine patch superfamily)
MINTEKSIICYYFHRKNTRLIVLYEEDPLIRSVKGKSPRIAESAFISEAAYIVGDVEIGENSSVWPGAVIRADYGKIVIGSNCAIEDNVVIHTGSPKTVNCDVFLGNNVQIGHSATLNCHKVGSYVLIGMNSTLLHDAVIGDYCVIGANCLVMEDMKVPDNSFVVGVPGKIKGKVSEEQLFWLQDAPKLYAELIESYREAGL